MPPAAVSQPAAHVGSAEPADKPGSVVDSHSSGRRVAAALKQPTRRHRGPRHRLPIWPCSRWGLPCRSVAGLAVRSYRTVSPLPRASCDAVRRSALCCTFRRLAPPRRYLAPCPVEPGLSSTRSRAPRLPGRLRGAHSTACVRECPRFSARTTGPAQVGLQAAAAARRLLARAILRESRPQAAARPSSRPAGPAASAGTNRSLIRRRTAPCAARRSARRRAWPPARA